MEILVQIEFVNTAFTGIATGAVALLLTVIVDSMFWQRYDSSWRYIYDHDSVGYVLIFVKTIILLQFHSFIFHHFQTGVAGRRGAVFQHRAEQIE